VHVDAAAPAGVLFPNHTGSMDHRAKHAWDVVKTFLRVFIRREAAATVPGSSNCVLTRFTRGPGSANEKTASDSQGRLFSSVPVGARQCAELGESPRYPVSRTHAAPTGAEAKPI
jgi:hypothetical protein